MHGKLSRQITLFKNQDNHFKDMNIRISNVLLCYMLHDLQFALMSNKLGMHVITMYCDYASNVVLNKYI